MQEKKYKIGDFVDVNCSLGNISGIVMQNSNKNVLVLKLKNGYNVGIDINSIKKISVKYAEGKKKISEKKELILQKNLPTISILHTGGTFASKVDYETGGVVAKFSPEELVEMFPEIKEVANIKSRLIGNLMSENMRFGHYNLLAKEIEKEIKEGIDGIIITHGTDTLHYSSAALSFILEDLSVPVILVGAQRSSDRPSSDAGMNLICAANFIAKTDFSGIAVCMHRSIEDSKCYILPGLKVRKMHSSRRDAFQVINGEAIAEVDYDKGNVKFISLDYRKRENGELKVKPIKEGIKVGILRSYPGLTSEEVGFYAGYDGLVLEGTGLGHFPIVESDEATKENSKIRKALTELARKTVLVMACQTIFGRVNMKVYSPGRDLMEIGVIGNGNDMTVETSFIKLAWLLSNYDKKKVKELFMQDLRGEFNKRILEKEFL